MLTTIQLIEDYLGVTLDSDQTVLYQQMIDAVDAYIEGVCDCLFTDAVYSEQVPVHCGLLQARNPVQFVYGFRSGLVDAIRVTPPTDGVISIERPRTGGMFLRLIDGLNVSDETLSTITIGGVQTMINADSAWDSSVVDVAYSAKLALYLAGDTRQDDETDFIYLQAFMTPYPVRRQTTRMFSTDAPCGEGLLVYRGGFAVVPADLQDLATRMVIKAYADRNPAASLSGEVKSQTIGDWSETKFTANELTASFNALAVPYQSVLDKYRNFTI